MPLASVCSNTDNKSVKRENQRLKEIVSRLKAEIINLRNRNESNVLINFCPVCKKFHDRNSQMQKWMQ